MRMRSLSSERQISRRHFLSHASLDAALASSFIISLGAGRLTDAAEVPDTMKIDPASGTAGVLLTQRMMDSPQPPPTYVDFWKQVFITKLK